MKRLLFALLAVFVLFNQLVFATEKIFIYKETTGKTSITSKWSVISRDEGYSIIAESPNEYHHVLCTQDHATISWEFKNTGLGTELLAKRDGNRLIVNGRFKKKEINTEYKIDHLPWFEFIEVALSGFVQSEEEKIEFWIIQPNNLKLYQMVAIKQKTETLNLNGQDVEALRIKVTLPGFSSLFWSAQYWFRKSDGVYLRYEGVRGGPGTPKTRVELIK